MFLTIFPEDSSTDLPWIHQRFPKDSSMDFLEDSSKDSFKDFLRIHQSFSKGFPKELQKIFSRI